MIDKIKANTPLHNCWITDENVFEHPLNSMGKNWHTNNNTHALPGYHPLVAINRFFVDGGGFVERLEIECSLPKLLFQNNLYELRNANRNSVYQILSKRLFEMGIYIIPKMIPHLNVCYVEYGKNICTGNIPVSYILEELYRAYIPKNHYIDVEKVAYRNGGKALVFWCEGYEIIFYDKTLETVKELSKRPGIVDPVVSNLFLGNTPPNVLRMEVRFHNRPTLKNFLEDNHFATGVTLREVFSKQVSQYVLQYYWNQLHKSARKINTSLISPAFELWKIHQHYKPSTRNDTQRKLAKLGLRYLIREHGYNGAKLALQRIGCSNPATYIRTYVKRVFQPYRKLEVCSFIKGALTRFTCLSRTKWIHFKPKPGGPCLYENEHMLTVKDIAKYLATTAKTVSELIATGKLLAKELKTNIYRIRHCHLMEYLST